MMLVFLYILNVVLITRAPWVFYDEQVRSSVLAAGFVIQLSALLLLQWGLAVLFMIAGIILINLLTWFLERRMINQGVKLGARLVGLACWLMVLGFLCSDLLDVSFSDWTIKMIHRTRELSDALDLIGQKHLLIILACCAGTFLAVVEANTAVRFLFQTLNVKPAIKRGDKPGGPTLIDQVEYNRGRVIGALERLITFFFVLKGAYGALAFLIAAKGMTRFKQLDDREFAEYFLIGTFLSIILAGSAALITQCLIEIW